MLAAALRYCTLFFLAEWGAGEDIEFGVDVGREEMLGNKSVNPTYGWTTGKG